MEDTINYDDGHDICEVSFEGDDEDVLVLRQKQEVVRLSKYQREHLERFLRAKDVMDDRGDG